MEEVKNLWLAIYDLAESLLGHIGEFSLKLMDIMGQEVGDTGVSILQLMLGVGVGIFVGKTVAKWVVDFL